MRSQSLQKNYCSDPISTSAPSDRSLRTLRFSEILLFRFAYFPFSFFVPLRLILFPTSVSCLQSPSSKCVLDAAFFADDSHLDLARVAELLLDAFGDVAGEMRDAVVVDHIMQDSDDQLSPRLHGIGALDTSEFKGYLF